MLEFRLGRSTTQPARNGRAVGFELVIDGAEFFEGAVAEPRAAIDRPLRHLIEVLASPAGHSADMVLSESRRVLCVWRRGAEGVVLASYSTVNPASEFRGPVEVPWLEFLSAVRRVTGRSALVPRTREPNPPAAVLEFSTPAWRLTLDDRDGLLAPDPRGLRSSAWLLVPGRLTVGSAREARPTPPPLLRLWAALRGGATAERHGPAEKSLPGPEIAARVIPELLAMNPGLGRSSAMRDLLRGAALPRPSPARATAAPPKPPRSRHALSQRPLASAGVLRRLRFSTQWTFSLRAESGTTGLLPVRGGIAARGPRDVVRLTEAGVLTLDVHGMVSATLAESGEVMVTDRGRQAFFGPRESTARWVRSRATPRPAIALCATPGRLVVGYSDGAAAGFEPQTGALRWAHRPTVPGASVFQFLDHHLWIFTRAGGCQTLEVAHGRSVQAVNGLGLREADPVVAHGALWVFSRSRGRSTLWRLKDGSPPEQSPWTSGTPVALAAGGARSLWAVTHVASQNTCLSFSKRGAVTAQATFRGAQPLAVFATRGGCILVDVAGHATAVGSDGQVRWSRPAAGPTRLPRVAPTLGRNLLVLADDESMTALDATTGRALAQVPRDTRLAAMAVDRHGHIYELTEDGRLTSHQLKATFGLVEGGATSSPSRPRLEPSR